MPHDSQRRAFITRGDGGDVVIVCANCGAEKALQPNDGVLTQITAFLEEHQLCD